MTEQQPKSVVESSVTQSDPLPAPAPAPAPASVETQIPSPPVAPEPVHEAPKDVAEEKAVIPLDPPDTKPDDSKALVIVESMILYYSLLRYMVPKALYNICLVGENMITKKKIKGK